MARRKYGKKRRSGGSKKLPLSIAVPMGVVGYSVAKDAMAGNVNMAALRMTGFDAASPSNKFKPEYLVATYGPIMAGVFVHKIAGRMGANRYIPKWLPVSI